MRPQLKGALSSYKYLLLLLFFTVLVSCAWPTDDPMKPEDIPATNIAINEGPGPLTVVTNDRGTLTATVLPADHTEGEVVWSSSSDDIVSISQDGPTNATFLAVAVGRATITARVGNVSNTIDITVSISNVPATNVDILAENPLTVTNGQTGTLMAEVTPEGYTDGPITWASDNPQAVTIDSRGVYQAVAVGSATITARVGN